MNDWLVLIVVYLAVFISSPLIAILHECGHAIAYLIFTKPDKIDIYIGTYKLPENAIKFQIGKLHFFMKRSFPFVKGIGLCKSEKSETNYRKLVVILLAGSFFTFFIAGILAMLMINTEAPLLVKIAFYIFLGLSTLSLLTNLIPSQLDKNFKTILNSDGQQLVLALKLKKSLPDYVAGRMYLVDNNFEYASKKLKKVLDNVQLEEVIRLLIFSLISGKQYNEANFYLSQLESSFKMSPTDHFYRGCLQSLTHKHDEAIETYSKVLKMDRHHVLALNNIGFELIEKGAHQVAKQVLDKAIKLNPNFGAPYGNLGYSQILQGDLESGKILVDKCLQFNPLNAEAYKSLCIYYLKKDDAAGALENFKRATEIDNEIDFGIYADKLKLLMGLY
jgi:hypothetical protein